MLGECIDMRVFYRDTNLRCNLRVYKKCKRIRGTENEWIEKGFNRFVTSRMFLDAPNSPML